GMKAALNGSLNLSILDGWWAEFYDEQNGWAIPSADSAGDSAERDKLEADAMYDLIEHQIAPRFYDRDADDVPTNWVGAIRHTLSTLSPELSADRMVREYVERLYLPAAAAARLIAKDRYAPARALAAWKDRVTAAWPSIQVSHVESGGVDAVPQVGDELHVRAQVNLDGLSAEDVAVEVVYGRAREGDRLENPERIELVASPEDPASAANPLHPVQFTGTVTLSRSGSFGYNVRVVPRNPLLASPAELGLIAVAS
ncbi:MAG: glycosyltransferase family 1 protein, partial [Microbacteriaceae bacterium]|nr:glycosyltransferase family 1 protein [Microbacteriaceae bacterium]